MSNEQFIQVASELGIKIESIKGISIRGNRGFRIGYTTDSNTTLRYKEFFNKALSIIAKTINIDLVWKYLEIL